MVAGHPLSYPNTRGGQPVSYPMTKKQRREQKAGNQRRKELILDSGIGLKSTKRNASFYLGGVCQSGGKKNG
jgi:hypothetical protein